MGERREFPRADLHINAVLCLLSTEGTPIRPRECFVHDISEGGARITVEKYYHCGQPVILTVRTRKDSEILTLAAVIVRTRNMTLTHAEYGIKFLNLSAHALEVLRSEVEELLMSEQVELPVAIDKEKKEE